MNPFSFSKLPAVDVAGINATIESALASAGLQTHTGPMRDVTETIRRALGSASNAGPASHAEVPDGDVIDVIARDLDAEDGTAAPVSVPAPSESIASGQFLTRRFASSAGARAYKLYIPASSPATPMPLLVMLHGCTQSPDDFAAGTQMNRLAEQHGFLVVYPEQTANANGSKCWNWFKAQDQARDSGEPSLIAGITREVAANYPVDARRIFVAGLSAGAAMAVILGQTYPELYAGVGAHSGLPYAAAHDLPSALAAMKGKGSLHPMPDLANLPGSVAAAPGEPVRFVPTIVFHGDRDRTVHQGNGTTIVQQASAALDSNEAEPKPSSRNESGVAPRGRRYSRTVVSDASGLPRIESWVLHGAGHAWSGGDAGGTYTDGTGPDASAEMVRFFLAQPLAGSA